MDEDLSIFKRTWLKWRADNAPGFAAALAYYALFSVVPLLIIVIAIFGVFIGSKILAGETYRILSENLGVEVAEFLESVLVNTANSSAALVSIISAALTLMGALGIFAQLRRSLDIMWEAPPRKARSFWRALIPDTGLFLMILMIGCTLVAGAAFSTIMSAMISRIADAELDLKVTVILADILGSLILTGVLVYAIYRFLPNKTLPRHDMLFGAGLTAVLFTLGKVALNVYFQFSHTISVYGTARAVIILLLWVYYSAQIFYLGAEFTYVYSEHRQGPSPL